jgi:hypothetical protein
MYVEIWKDQRKRLADVSAMGDSITLLVFHRGLIVRKAMCVKKPWDRAA